MSKHSHLPSLSSAAIICERKKHHTESKHYDNSFLRLFSSHIRLTCYEFYFRWRRPSRRVSWLDNETRWQTSWRNPLTLWSTLLRRWTDQCQPNNPHAPLDWFKRKTNEWLNGESVWRIQYNHFNQSLLLENKNWLKRQNYGSWCNPSICTHLKRESNIFALKKTQVFDVDDFASAIIHVENVDGRRTLHAFDVRPVKTEKRKGNERNAINRRRECRKKEKPQLLHGRVHSTRI